MIVPRYFWSTTLAVSLRALSELKKTSYPNFQELLIRFEYDGCPEKRDEILVGEGGSNAAKRVQWHRAWTKSDPTSNAQGWLSTDSFVKDVLTTEESYIVCERPSPKPDERIPEELLLRHPAVISNYPKQILNITKASLLVLGASFASAIAIAILPLDNTVVGVVPMMGSALSAALLYVVGYAASKHDASTSKNERNFAA
jgi:hypothetical protein